ncbi:CoA ester lyase [Afifella sp. IM 167]|uniref:HpcH/HpaI aldolase/citrate lyase family protein n=1 Tax=Afifella sp. IM 167 TaxID=2033586 RepID=UPI001CCD0D8D|nr:CoA ester lyase [Afifella sp. IM 167]MBZ8132318.1 CoA ester lyase [Afifella sp. IM 167]
MRSYLFVPGDSERKLQKSLASGADALILDLEDSVSPDRKGAARKLVSEFLLAHRGKTAPALFVRINAFDSGLSESDLEHVMTGAPSGIVLPKAAGGADVALLSSRIAVGEALHGIEDGATRILPIASETARAVFSLGTYDEAGPRLAGLAWGGEDLSADIGSLSTKEANGGWTEPYRLVRNLCLFGAASAGVDAVDTVYTDFSGADGLLAECEAAARDGFAGKLAIHPNQVELINRAFTPSEAAISEAQAIVDAFRQAGGAGVVGLGGKMIDRPHLKLAERLLKRAGRND